jgi:hypothetical protein
MEPLIFSEEKDLPKVPFLMVAVMADGKEKPFYVARVGRGAITGATMMNGEFLESIISNPTNIGYLKPDCSGNERLYIQNENQKGKHRDIDYYREMTPEETKIWKEKLLPLLGKDVFQKHVESYQKANEEAKQLFTSLDTMLV